MDCSKGHANQEGQSFCGICGERLTEEAADDRSADPAGGPQTSVKMPALLIVAYVALAAAFLGSFLPWARILFVTVNGTDGDGVITAIASAGAGACLLISTRREGVNRSLLVGAMLLSGVAAAVYLYDANRLTSAFGETDGGMFGEIKAAPQLGLYMGALGSVLALGATALLAARSYRPHALRDAPTATMVALTAGFCAIALVAVPSWWGLTVIAALLALGLGFAQRRQEGAVQEVKRPATFALAAGLIGLLGGIGGAAFGSDGRASVATCSDVFADGVTTEQAWEEDGVTCEDADGSRTWVWTMEAFCWEQDEEPLVNDFGWGYVGEPWEAGEDAPDC